MNCIVFVLNCIVFILNCIYCFCSVLYWMALLMYCYCILFILFCLYCIVLVLVCWLHLTTVHLCVVNFVSVIFCNTWFVSISCRCFWQHCYLTVSFFGIVILWAMHIWCHYYTSSSVSIIVCYFGNVIIAGCSYLTTLFFETVVILVMSFLWCFLM